MYDSNRNSPQFALLFVGWFCSWLQPDRMRARKGLATTKSEVRGGTLFHSVFMLSEAAMNRAG